MEDLSKAFRTLCDQIGRSVCGSAERYHEHLYLLPSIVKDGGFNQSISISSSDFSRMMKSIEREDYWQIAYCHDLINLCDCALEAHGQAADALCDAFRLTTMIRPLRALDDGEYEIRSPETHAVVRHYEDFFVRLYSSLDILSKVLAQVDDLPSAFSGYLKLSKRDMLFSKYRNRSNPYSSTDGHIAKPSWEKTYLEELRNEIVHNRSLDPKATAYVKIVKGTIVSRWILLPDAEESGRLCKWVNRHRFYSQQLRAGDIGPRLLSSITSEMINSINIASSSLCKEDHT